MPTPSPERFNKVGFTPQQAAALQDLTAQDMATLRRARFTARQSRVLLGGDRSTRTLIRTAHFTKAQTELVQQIV